MLYDVAIIGGSYAGLSAAMPLVRARKNIIVIDAGERRNRFAEHSHGFLTQDGTPASEIVSQAKEQLQKYSTFEWQTGSVKRIETVADEFYICVDQLRSIQAKRIIIASGVTDQLPNIQGLAERWGKSVFHCPYCHGYELNLGSIAILATNPHVFHMAMMLPDWGTTTLLLNGQALLNDFEKEQLQKRAVILDDRTIQCIDHHADIVFDHGEVGHFDGLFVQTKPQIQQAWIEKLGCKIEENEFGQFLQTSVLKETSVKSIFACGDVARLGGSVPLAVGDGMLAGMSAHKSLIF